MTFVPPSFGVSHLLDAARSTSTVPPRSLCSCDGLSRTAAARQHGQRSRAIPGLLMVAGDSGDEDAIDLNAMDVLKEVTFDDRSVVGKLMRTLNPRLFVPVADSASAETSQLDGAPLGEGASNASSDSGGSTAQERVGDPAGIETLLPPPRRPRTLRAGGDVYNGGGVGVGVMNALGGLTELIETSLQMLPTQLPRRLIQVHPLILSGQYSCKSTGEVSTRSGHSDVRCFGAFFP